MPVEFPHSDDDLEEIVDVDELAASLGLGAPDNHHHHHNQGGGDRYSSSSPISAAAGNNNNNDDYRAIRPSQQEAQALSPADGYFGRSDSGRSRGPPNAYNSRSNASHGRNNDNYRNNIPISSQVPHVPDRWVSDPSLDQGTQESDKAREAREERQQYQNTRPFATPDRQLNQNLTSTSPATDVRPDAPSPSSAAFSLLNPSHRPHTQEQLAPPVRTTTRDLHEDNNKYNNTHDFYSRAGPSTATSSRASAGAGPSSTPRHQFTPRYPSSSSSPSAFHIGSAPVAAALPPPHPISRPRRSSTAYSERSSLFSEAPPAYTPSPTSPTSAASTTVNHYQTFSPPSPPSSSPPTSSSPPNMGRPSESEARGLLVGQVYQAIPESMGGDPDQHDDNEFTYPRPTLRERLKRFSFRRQWKMIVLALVLLFVTIGFLVTSIKGIKKEVS